MKHLIFITLVLLFCVTAYAKPHCQGFNNYDDRVTIVFTDDNTKNGYSVTDVKFIPTWKGAEHPATSVKTTVEEGTATVTLTFSHITQFSNPKVTLRINGMKTKFKVCQ